MIILSTLKKVLFWSYERGTWQYDVMCVLILAFIFLTPNRLFQAERAKAAHSTAAPSYLSREELGQVSEDRIAESIRRRLREKEGREVEVSRIEVQADRAGKVTGYLVWSSQPAD